MADASKEGEDCEKGEVSAKAGVSVEGNLHSALLTIAQGVPNVWPTGLDSGREEFSSVCVARLDFELSNSAQRPAITLRLRDQATWWAVRPYLMEMPVGKKGSIHFFIGLTNAIDNLLCRRIFPTLSVIIEGLKADAMCTFFLDLMPKDQNVYRYRSGLWMSLQFAKPYPPPNHVHALSLLLSKHVVIKSPPNSKGPVGQIYLPRYHILRHLTAEEATVRQQSEKGCRNELPAPLEYVGTYTIPETAFVAVSNYCSRHIASLKIERNS
ncbi:T-box protein 12 [Taenia solium]|eukprot:TsM_000441500 transcript=TsM_000441500 gene=TsM_000441500